MKCLQTLKCDIEEKRHGEDIQAYDDFILFII